MESYDVIKTIGKGAGGTVLSCSSRYREEKFKVWLGTPTAVAEQTGTAD